MRDGIWNGLTVLLKFFVAWVSVVVFSCLFCSALRHDAAFLFSCVSIPLFHCYLFGVMTVSCSESSTVLFAITSTDRVVLQSFVAFVTA